MKSLSSLDSKSNSMFEKLDKIFFGTPFKIIYLLFSFMTYFIVTYGTSWMSVGVWASAITGTILFLYRVIRIPNYIKTKRIWILIAFYISYIISLVLNINYGYAEAVKALVWMAFHYYLLYACDVKQEPKVYQKEFHIIANVYLAILFAAAIASFVLLCIGYSYYSMRGEFEIVGGFTWGRLWGVFTDPNYGSVFCSIGIILSLYFFHTWKNIVLRILYICNILMLSIYIIFSDSRTGIVAIMFSLAFYVYALLIRWEKFKLKMELKQIISILIAMVIMVGVYFIPKGVTAAYNQIVENVTSNQMIEDPSEPPTNNKVFGREQDLEDDISNGRLELWYSSVEIFLTKPIFGVSFFNLRDYALAELPDTYLITKPNGKVNNPHSVIFNILAGQGIVGITIFFIFCGAVFIYIVRRFYRVEKKDYHYIIVLMSSIVACGVSMLFLSDVFYVHTPNSFVFWTFLGYLMHYFRNKIPLPFRGFQKKEKE